MAGAEAGARELRSPEQQTGVDFAPFPSACKEADPLALSYLSGSVASHAQPVPLGRHRWLKQTNGGDTEHRVPGWGEAMRGRR